MLISRNWVLFCHHVEFSAEFLEMDSKNHLEPACFDNRCEDMIFCLVEEWLSSEVKIIALA